MNKVPTTAWLFLAISGEVISTIGLPGTFSIVTLALNAGYVGYWANELHREHLARRRRRGVVNIPCPRCNSTVTCNVRTVNTLNVHIDGTEMEHHMLSHQETM